MSPNRFAAGTVVFPYYYPSSEARIIAAIFFHHNGSGSVQLVFFHTPGNFYGGQNKDVLHEVVGTGCVACQGIGRHSQQDQAQDEFHTYPLAAPVLKMDVSMARVMFFKKVLPTNGKKGCSGQPVRMSVNYQRRA